ncbi:bacteriocin-protection, YdeI or OmpD-associated-domain-containing protein [Bombardia bombarda]|uniref:Bacteriocin-protection, YdeI or OmpD-associated-domain-containing protein n=1 Tax=Bombardia bombarda TaxID=252184 RepID=A0AA39XC35_9PEZI|nr:bacteriocin-protection, YdeI or OmpD-associated-domain-containing protein [Bombardia bombarda]
MPSPAPSIPTRLFQDASAFESWLETNHGTETAGFWMKISKKGGSAALSVSYAEALDAALGSRRDAKTVFWSKRNVDKVAQLIEAGRMRPAGQLEIEAAKADGRWQKAYASSSSIQVPAAFQAALQKNKRAKTFFETLNRSKRYTFLWRIETAKRDETRKRRIEQLVDLLAEHKTL